MVTFRRAVVTHGGKQSVYTFTSNQLKTNWLQGDKPTEVQLTAETGESVTIELADKVTKQGRHVLTGFKTSYGLHIKIVFTCGVDDRRPSFAGTISIRERREAPKRAA